MTRGGLGVSAIALVPTEHTKSYNFGVKIVPAFLLPPVIVTKENAAKGYANDPVLAPLTK